MATLGQNVESVQISGWTQAVNKETTVNVTVNVPNNGTVDNGTVTVDIKDAEGVSVVSKAAVLKIEKGTKTGHYAAYGSRGEGRHRGQVYGRSDPEAATTPERSKSPFTVNLSAQTSAEAFAAGKATAGIDQDGSAASPTRTERSRS